MNKTYLYWQNLKDDLMGCVEKEVASRPDRNGFSRSMDLLIDFAFANGHTECSPEIGYAFCEHEKSQGKKEATFCRRRKTIRRLNEYLYGNPCWQRTPRELRKYTSSHILIKCPDQFSDVFEEFLQFLKRDGLKYITIEMYRHYCTKSMLCDFAQQSR